MCLIMFSKNINNIQKDWYKNSKESNKDGLGVMFPQDGRLIVRKAVNDKYQDTLFNAVKKKIKKGVPVAFHQRYGTSGKKDITNVHPFKLLSIDEGDSIDLYMMHNGIINIKEIDNLCDTATYVEYVLKPLLKKDNDLWRKHEFKVLMDLSIGNSKLLFMDNKGNVEIVGEDKGEWKDKVWLSTPSYIEANTWGSFKDLTYPSYYHGGYGGYYDCYDKDKEEDDGNNIAFFCDYCGREINDKETYYWCPEGGFAVCSCCAKEFENSYNLEEINPGDDK